MRRILRAASSRVADEDVAAPRSPPPSRGASFLCGIAPALFSCLSSHPRRINGPDGVWASSEMPQTSELTHLMVRDSLRYAILM